MMGVCMAQLTWRTVAFVSALSAANAFHSAIPGPYLESSTMVFSKCRVSFIGQGRKNHRQPCQNALLALRGNAGAAEEGLKRPISRPIPAVDASVSPAPPKKNMFKVVKRADGSKPAAGKAVQDKGTGTRTVPAGWVGAAPSTVSDYNKEIARLGKAGQWQDAIDTLQVMQGKGLKPTVVSYNSALNVLAKNGQWQEALDMFDRVFRGDNSLKPDSFSYNAVLTACAKGNLVKRAFELFEEMEKGGVAANEFTYNSLMNACERSGTQFTCFTGAKVQILTQKALLEKPGKAIEVFEDMQARGIKPNVYTFTSAISACETGGKWEDALGYMARMTSEGIQPTIQTYSAAISACEKGGQARPALGLLERMRNARIEPDVIVYSAAICACGKAGLWESALKLFEEMEGKGLLPDLVTYSTLIKAYERAGQWERALEVMKVMQDNAITPNVITYSTAISAVAKAGQWRAALGLLEHMRKDKVQPDAVTYNYVISALSKGGQWDAALRLLQECLDIEGQEAAQMSTYCTVIKCLGDNGEWEKALGVIGAMEGKAITPTSEVIEVLIDALENCKQTTLAQELRDKLKSRKILNKG